MFSLGQETGYVSLEKEKRALDITEENCSSWSRKTVLGGRAISLAADSNDIIRINEGKNIRDELAIC